MWARMSVIASASRELAFTKQQQKAAKQVSYKKRVSLAVLLADLPPSKRKELAQATERRIHFLLEEQSKLAAREKELGLCDFSLDKRASVGGGSVLSFGSISSTTTASSSTTLSSQESVPRSITHANLEVPSVPPSPTLSMDEPLELRRTHSSSDYTHASKGKHSPTLERKLSGRTPGKRSGESSTLACRRCRTDTSAIVEEDVIGDVPVNVGGKMGSSLPFMPDATTHRSHSMPGSALRQKRSFNRLFAF
eukprot:comp11461_c0_seq1/m.5896 comp11461_c0_seq1/g.5896  ORF comp11461_c0_seq1/g.5896 comp11461_c0_seq1/m.5896 type:complete len:251 (-) comp11461_c0_seq1:136-888(-)